MKKLLLLCLCAFACDAAELTVTENTRAAIQSAIDRVAACGGGRVVVPAGKYVTGTIRMRSNVELHLAKGAVLKGSTKEADYNKNDEFPENFWSVAEEWSGAHLILGYKVKNAAVTGEGVIDGSGPDFFGDCDEDSRWPYYKFGLKLHPIDREWFRPGPMVAFFLSKNIRIEDVTMINPPAWTCHVRCSDGFTARNVKIEADRTIANSDGFSIDCTRNVVVEKCTLRTGDDGFAIRAACKHHAVSNFCENIRIRDCDVWSCCYGIRFGIGSGNITNIVVENTRIHEAAGSAFGFSPSWVRGTRNCYIQDVTVKNCEVWDSVRPVGAFYDNNCRVDGIRFEDCTFNTLLPVNLDTRCGIHFERCTRNMIPRCKVRHRKGWNERGIRQEKGVFIRGGASGNVTMKDCKPLPLGSQGVLLLAFDDRNFGDWERAMPIFEKYGAHASFFVSGAFDSEAVKTCKRLMAGGHTIGLHGANHANVPDAIKQFGNNGWWDREVETEKKRADVAYVPIHSFAYPNNAHDDGSDKFLLTRFERVRVGLKGVRPYDAAGKLNVADFKPLVTDDRLFSPVKDLPKKRMMGGIILGEAYHTDIEDVAACVRRAAERKEVLLFTSHGISPDAKHINMKTAWLERILAEAQKGNMLVLGFDELP